MAPAASSLLGRGLRLGLLGGQRRWQMVLGLVALARLVRRVVRPGSGPVVHRQRVHVGEGIEIRHLPASAFDGSGPSGR
ncbi:MAG: hypothetical protein H8E59_05795 [Actinobacteria bacterium]|nr:hypothetical protein [Actinomycetota bacterium]